MKVMKEHTTVNFMKLYLIDRPFPRGVVKG